MAEAKLFKVGGSQAVRLPKDFRLPGDSVQIRWQGDEVVLTPARKPKTEAEIRAWLAEIQSAAQAENRSVEEILQEAIRQYLDNRSWTKILGYGQRRAKEVGLTEADIDRAIAETRAE